MCSSWYTCLYAATRFNKADVRMVYSLEEYLLFVCLTVSIQDGDS